MKRCLGNLIGALLLASILTGCGLKEAKQDAEKVVTRHFQALATNNVKAAMADYSSDFFNRTPQAEWAKALENLNTKLGAYQGYSVQGCSVFKKAGTLTIGTTVSLRCQVTYANHPATETFTLFKSSLDDDFKIIAHRINSDGL